MTHRLDSAVSVLLSLAKQHSAHPHFRHKAMLNMAALSTNGLRKLHQASWAIRGKTQSSSLLSAANATLNSSLARSTSSQVASLSLWQSSRGGPNNSCFPDPSKRGLGSLRYMSKNSDNRSQNVRCTSSSLPQVETPATEGFFGETSEVAFKGLETDFPCLMRVKDSGPEPAYDKITKGFKLFNYDQNFQLKINRQVLPRLDVAYETWGELNEDRSNAVVILAGLSASSHARSSVDNMQPGWWEKFVGPGCAVDTNKFFVICPNNLGGCYGTTGPSSINVLTGKPYGTTFPIIGVADMVEAIFRLIDHLGIDRLHGCVGSSLGGMLSLQSAVSFPERVGRLISISSCAHSHPSSIALRYLQRKCIMCDPNWNKGHYYDGPYPKVGMKLAREIATMTYRSGPEWDERFGRKRLSEEPPSLCPTFLIESYLEHQGESFSTKFDPNSLLYISKAMDLFDLSEGYSSLEEGLSTVKCPVMIIGVQTDILFPIWQQRELAEKLQEAGNEQVTFYELNSLYGHDTFLLDLNGVGAAVKGFLETEQSETGWLTKHKRRHDERKHF